MLCLWNNYDRLAARVFCAAETKNGKIEYNGLYDMKSFY